jgi:magnesium chelatase family protein
MLAKIHSATVEGVNGLLVEVEVDIAFGLPAFATVGLPEAAVRESKDRVKAAIKNSGYEFPAHRITVNLAPADLRKAGTGYDLPIAVGIVAASGIVPAFKLERYLLIGELSLDGRVRPVPGVLPIVMAARREKLSGVVVPVENAREAAVVQGIDVIPVSHLHQAIEFFAGIVEIAPEHVDLDEFFQGGSRFDADLCEVKGQEHAKRALEIAAAGGHNLLFEGPPGSGKTMMARRLPSIMPDLTLDEALETTGIYSVAGLVGKDEGIVIQRPFRAPHHSISDAGLIGGGQIPRPGEVSLAHNGVLFLDELAEFKKNILEGLRQPLEDGSVTISRASSSLSFPANFILVAASNPCPCGFLGDHTHECSCSPIQVQRYRSRISGPLLDRIDMYVEVAAVPFKELSAQSDGESSATVKARVVQARAKQRERFASLSHVYSNSQMPAKLIKRFCSLDRASEQLLEKAMLRLGLSARAFRRIQKIARTIADLAAEEQIQTPHVAEAIQYRRLDRKQTNGAG